MSNTAPDRAVPENAAEAATCDEIRSLFADDPESLRLLAQLLTADAEKAEKCFVDGLESCAASNNSFRTWARAWAVRTIIRNAIAVVSPAPPRADTPPARIGNENDTPSLRALIAAVTALGPFDRFAFVMSVLEGYPLSECCALLSCTADEIEQARSRALAAVAFAGESVITAITFAKACSGPLRLTVRTR